MWKYKFNNMSNIQKTGESIMNNINFFEPSLHGCMITMTGGGKTTLGSKIFSNLEHRAIFVDFQSEKIFDDNTFIRTADRLGDAFAITDKVVLRTIDTNEISDMVRWIFTAKKMKPKFAETDIYLFFDEIQKYSTIPIIEDVFQMGRKWNVHGIFMVRDIQEMKNLRIISQCDEMIFLKMNDIGLRKMMQNYGIKIPPIVLKHINSGKRNEKDKLISDFNSTLYDKFSWMLFDKDGEFVGEFNPFDGEIENVENKKPENGEISNEISNPKSQESNEAADN